jgi:hypothetical protein
MASPHAALGVELNVLNLPTADQLPVVVGVLTRDSAFLGKGGGELGVHSQSRLECHALSSVRDIPFRLFCYVRLVVLIFRLIPV